MIDLRERELPSGITFDGIFYELDTDFRTWISFDYDVRVNHIMPVYIFKGEHPKSAAAKDAVLEFLKSPNVTPRHRSTDSNGAVPFDYVLDGDYIVASFQQAYGIDLTACEYMHWHRFKALLNGLPEDTVLSRAIGYRTWAKDSKGYDDRMAEQRALWRLPEPNEEQAEQELIQWTKGLGL